MTITPDGEEGSSLPPSQRDLRSGEDFVRAHSRNLRALGQGFTTGRMVTPRAVTGIADSEDDSLTDDGGNPADDTHYEWEWNDRYTVVTATGNQVVHLTYVPVEESLFVFWHPAGGGGLPITNEHFTLVDNVVTLYDPGILAVGDEFSFQYMLDPGVFPEPPPDAATLYGVTFADFTDTEIAIPTGTPDGATLVLMMSAATFGSPFTFSDARFDPVPYYELLTSISSSVRIGTADGSTTPIPISLPTIPANTYGFAILASFTPLSLGAQAYVNETALPYTLDPVTALQALGFIFSTYNTVPGSLVNSSTDGWVTVGVTGGGGSIGMFLFEQSPSVSGPTPPGDFGYTGALGGADVVTAEVIPT